MNNIEEIIKERIKSSQISWKNNPFPHAILDNFLPDELFEKISLSSNLVGDIDNFKKSFTSHVELNKKVYGNNDLKGDLRLPVDIIGGNTLKKILENYLDIEGLISLNDWKNYGGYYPYHTMKTGGLLGAHVDHSHSANDNKLLHVANAIFYVSQKWDEAWGGETLLFNSTGFKIIKKISPKPNRLILFIHSSTSFHGVSKTNSPSEITRNTYYMDYYVNDTQIKKLRENLKKKINIELKYRYHSTLFIPLFPIELKSFSIISIFKKSTYVYLFKYFRYLIGRYLLGYNSSIHLKKLSFKYWKNSFIHKKYT